MAFIKETINKFKEAFISKFSLSTPVDTLWEEFKSMCSYCLTYVPTKNSRIGTKQPWITSHIKRLSRRKQRLYNKVRHSNSSHNWDTYRHLKRESNMNAARLTMTTLEVWWMKMELLQKIMDTLISKVKGRTTVEYPH